MTQKEKIKNLLADGAWHHQWDFINLGILAYNQRMNEMRRAGQIKVETRHDGSHWWWRLKRLDPVIAPPPETPQVTPQVEPDGQMRLYGISPKCPQKPYTENTIQRG